MKILFETIASVSIMRRPQDFNSNNHHDHSPYCVVYEHNLAVVFILTNFYHNYLTGETKENLKQYEYRLVSELPDGIKSLSDDRFLWMYKTYNSQYHFDAYCNEIVSFLPPFQIVPLTLEQRENLLLIASEPTEKQLCLLDQSLKTQLEEAIKLIPSKQLFVKLSNTSAKNDQPVTPCKSVHDIVNFLCNLRECRKRLRDITTLSIVLMPFNDSINNNNEYRVYVQQCAIKAICPQNWSSVRFFSADQVREIVSQIQMLLSKIFDCCNRNNQVKSGVFDVYLLDHEAHLIEINPWGSFSSSGSSLFHWLKDGIDSDSSSKQTDYIHFRNVDLYNNKVFI